MKKIIPLLLVFALAGCNLHNTSDRLTGKHIKQIEGVIKEDSTKGEDFLSFFDQFKKDTLFQQERLCLPFYQGVTVDDGSGVIRDSTIIGDNKKDWLFCSFLINDSVNYFHQDIVVKHDTVEVSLSQNPSSNDSREIDAGFVRKNGKWFNYSLWITR